MKLKRLLESDNANGIASILLLFDKLKTNSNFMQYINQITQPIDKYKAIVKFGEILGIPSSKFIDFVTNMKNIKQHPDE